MISDYVTTHNGEKYIFFASILCLCVLLFYSSCSEPELTSTDSWKSKKTSCKITLYDSVITMSAGSICYFDFSISSRLDDVLKLEDDSAFCVELTSVANNLPRKNYKLTDITKLSDDSNIISGRYRGYIEDLNIKNNYVDSLTLSIIIKKTGQTFCSPKFCVKFVCDSITKVLLNTGLPLVEVKTVDGIEPVCDYVLPPDGCVGASIQNAVKVKGKCTIMKDSCILYNSKNFQEGESGITIKIRGNTSACYTKKKPYKLKLQKKCDLLNRGDDKKYKEKDWVLLKYDGLRTLVGFELSRLLDMQWTPSFQFVNLIINGDYKGIYMLTESVKRNEDCRVAVSESGFIIEYDAYWWNENLFFVSDYSDVMNYTFKYPDDEDISENQIVYTKNSIDTLESVINKEGGNYECYIDIDSWVKWILAHDILGNSDGAGTNLYIAKNDSTLASLLILPTLWDFGGILGPVDKWSELHTWRGQYFSKLFSNTNDVFRKKYKEYWGFILPFLFEGLTNYLIEFNNSSIANCLNKSIEIENSRWDLKWNNVSEEIDIINTWLTMRKDFLLYSIPNL